MKLSKLFLIIGTKYNFTFKKDIDKVELMLWDASHETSINIKDKNIKGLIKQTKAFIKEIEQDERK